MQVEAALSMDEEIETEVKGVTVYSLINPKTKTVWAAFGGDEYKGDVLISIHLTQEGAISSVLEAHPDSPHFGVVREKELMG